MSACDGVRRAGTAGHGKRKEWIETMQAPVREGMRDSLVESGIADLGRIFDEEVVSRWNARLDDDLGSQAARRRPAADAGRLCALGIIDELFTPSMRRSVRDLVPGAQIYHATAFEVAGANHRSYVNSYLLDGWHRDAEPIPGFTRDALQYVSLFVYLSDVGWHNGAFALSTSDPLRRIRNKSAAIRVIGPAGTAFFWNRSSFYHRAAPNTSSRPRRLLKLSFQPIGLENPRVALPQFAAARSSLHGRDVYLERLFRCNLSSGESLDALPEVDAPPLAHRVPEPNDAVGFRTWQLPLKTLVKARDRLRPHQVKDYA
jgi:hypothetical protein